MPPARSRRLSFLLRLSVAFTALALAGHAGEPGPDPETRARRERFRRLYDEGNALYHQKHDEQGGMALYQQLLQEARLANDPPWLTSGLWKVAQVHGDAGRLDLSVELYEEAREIIFADPAEIGTANHFLVIGNLCSNYERLGKIGLYLIRHDDAVAQARAFLHKKHGVAPDADPFLVDETVLNALTNMGFIGQTFFREAQLRFMSGREDSAIELATRLERRLNLAPFKNHWERDLRARARLHLAAWCDEIGRAAERDRWENLLLVPEGEPGFGSADWQVGTLRRAARLHADGEDRPGQRARAEAALAALRAINRIDAWLDGQVLLARMLADDGDIDAGLALIDSALAGMADLQESRARARLLLARAELRMARGQTDETVLRDLVEALTWLRGVGGLREEARAHLLYASYLRRSGHPFAARDALADADARRRQFRSVPLDRLFQAEWAALAPDSGAVPARLPVPGDLQPLEIVTRLRAGESANARFSAANTGDEPIDGVLHVVGAVRGVAWDEQGLVWRVRLDDTSAVSEIRQAARLGPHDQARVVLRRDQGSGDAPATEVGWTVAGRRQTAWWRLATDTGARPASLRNDHLALANPFYAIPLHHPLGDEARARGGLVNLRVRSEPACRIELVDADTGGTLAVDARGDGDFLGAGDVLWRDADHDGHPELRPAPADTGGVELYVYPSRRDTDIRLTLEARQPDGDWRPQAVDTVLAAD